MAITQTQLNQARTATTNLFVAINQMENFVDGIQSLLNSNWVVTTTISGISVTNTISLIDQNALIAQYQTLKTNLLNTYNQLP